jgi:D-alanyl-D-alanine carboxypeptidase (penicillin-binding protein 5/6)
MKNLRHLCLSFVTGCCLAGMAAAQAFETRAVAAYVVDHNTGQALMSQSADLPLPPASMSKLMTLNMVFEALEDGRLALDTRLPVSQHAMDYGGSTMFLNTQDRVTVEDLIRGIVVLSGNDASAVFAEALSPDGTEDGFARMMTDRAQELGMVNSSFRNSNGWPAAGQVMSMRDLGLLAERLITVFPQYYSYFAETEFAFDGRAPDNRFNRNPLLALNIGADGLKTGHTQEAGFGLTGSAVQGARRVTFVITGLDTAQERADEAERIVNWAFRQFAEREVARADTAVAQALVFMGTADSVDLAPAEDLVLLIPVTQGEAVEAEVVYDGPIAAPIAAGQELGHMIIRIEGFDDQIVPLVAMNDVSQGGPWIRFSAAVVDVLRRILGDAPLAAAS